MFIKAGRAPEWQACVTTKSGSDALATMKRDKGFLMLKQMSLGASLVGGLITPCWAMEDSAVQRGRTFARVNCAQCHSIDRVTASPLKIAPPFRTLHTQYPAEMLAEALAEGISTGHPSMPEFRLDPDQVGDFIAFLKTFETGR